ncbi:MAG: hypothetical protein M1814_003065 [Vezdaea aestivalis]|nr:MAG: hypothetical protein M1814_003065 [Vezdaea aestivalis]
MAAIIESSNVPSHLQTLMRPSLLALAIVQSADPRISIREYAISLRTHLRNAPSARPVTSGGEPGCTAGCLDAASYWKQRFAESEAAQVELRDRVHELEVRNKALEENRGISGDSVGGSKPKERQTLPNLGAACAVIDMGELEKGAFEGFPGAHFVIRELYDLRGLIRQRNVNHTELASTLTKLLLALTKAFESTCRQADFHPTKSSSQVLKATKFDQPYRIETTFFAAARIRAYLMKGFERLGRSIQGQQALGRVIHSFVQHFDSTLSLFRTIYPKPAAGDPQPYFRISSGLSRHLSSLVLVLNRRLAGHKELMDGYVACLLHRTGTLLGRVVFELDVEASDDPPPPDRTSLLHELPYLTWILRSLSPNLKNEPSISTLAGRERAVLQQTILSAMFGELEGEFGGGPRFDSTAVAGLQLVRGIGGEDRVADFLEGVWSCVGWDIVGLKDEWEEK